MTEDELCGAPVPFKIRNRNTGETLTVTGFSEKVPPDKPPSFPAARYVDVRFQTSRLVTDVLSHYDLVERA